MSSLFVRHRMQLIDYRRIAAMKLTPLAGSEDIPFGTSAGELLKQLGPPESKQSLGDQDGYPRFRELYNYGDVGYLTAGKLGVVSVEIDTERVPVELWGHRVNQLSPAELKTLLHSNGCEVAVSDPNGWGDQSVDSFACGVIASYSDGVLVCIELQDPSWRQSAS